MKVAELTDLNQWLIDIWQRPPIPVSRYAEYRDTATNLSGINTGNTGIEVIQYRLGRY